MKLISYVFYAVVFFLLAGVVPLGIEPDERSSYYSVVMICLVALLAGAVAWRGVKRSRRSK